MNQYLKLDPWKIIEDEFNPSTNKASESIFSIGNGHIGQRANFEEYYSGDTLQGSYMAGIYYPDKTKVGWWKIGYPEYFAKVLNAPNWIGINIQVEDEMLDLAKCNVYNFKRELDMKEGILRRQFDAELRNHQALKVSAERFVSIAEPESGNIRYTLKPLLGDVQITITPYLDANVVNEDANYDEVFWDQISEHIDEQDAIVQVKTKKTEFHVCLGMKVKIFLDGKEIRMDSQPTKISKYVARRYTIDLKKGSVLTIEKYCAILSSLYHPQEKILKNAKTLLTRVVEKGYDVLLGEHKKKWEDKWNLSDIVIEGDVAAQQGIRFNIFQLNQTYTGDDDRLNIGPKGFTGEKYGGSTYWDTEAFCLPFYLCTADSKVARNLLLYRYKHLPKAIENAEKLGFKKGAALYPMVTMNGEECHNEWEITFEEIHRNGAIAFAIFNYWRHTNDNNYLIDYGLEVLIAISRFWSQRIHFSEFREKYVMLGVTGPNEYENNVNNNWYTNRIACWTIQYTLETIDLVKSSQPEKYKKLTSRISFDDNNETKLWSDIIKNMHMPEIEDTQIFLQQDGYLDKEQKTVKDLKPSDRPLNQKWSWDRILRSCFIKQADVLQGLYVLEHEYSDDVIKENYDYYEPRTVHESSLSPCIHSVIASKLGYISNAYKLYLRTSRLDLDDYNHEVHEGCHITSMAGTWLSIVEGFGGKRILNGMLSLNPQIPSQWNVYTFKILFRDSLLHVKVSQHSVLITNEKGKTISFLLYGNKIELSEGEIFKSVNKNSKSNKVLT